MEVKFTDIYSPLFERYFKQSEIQFSSYFPHWRLLHIFLKQRVLSQNVLEKIIRIKHETLLLAWQLHLLHSLFWGLMQLKITVNHMKQVKIMWAKLRAIKLNKHHITDAKIRKQETYCAAVDLTFVSKSLNSPSFLEITWKKYSYSRSLYWCKNGNS